MKKEYAERLKRDREHMWKYVEKHKATKCTEYPLHPDEEMRMKNDWLMSKNVKDILDGKTDENEIEKILNEWFILFRKYTIHPMGKTVTMIDIPVHDATCKIITKISK